MQSKLNKQVANKALSQKLWELGVNIKTIWYHISDEDLIPEGRIQLRTDYVLEWEDDNAYTYEISTLETVLDDKRWSDWNNKEGISIIPALTSSELGEILPIDINCRRTGVTCWYFSHDNGNEHTLIEAETEADARAKMLIHLIEQGLVSPKCEALRTEDINKLS